VAKPQPPRKDEYEDPKLKKNTSLFMHTFYAKAQLILS